MARKGPVKKSKADPDIKYKSSAITKFINSLCMMERKVLLKLFFMTHLK